MKHYSVNLCPKRKYGYRCLEIRWNGAKNVLPKNKLVATIYRLDLGLYSINDRTVECYDLDGAVEITMFALAKKINRRFPRSTVTATRIEQNWQ